MATAMLFAGQGSQAVGMADGVTARSAEARAILAAADEVLGYPLSRVMAEGPVEQLRQTEVTQPALLTLEVAEAQHLIARGAHPVALAGHSVGQYAALTIAGAVDFAAALRLVALRGRLMQQTVVDGDGAMVAVVGLDRETVYAACAEVRQSGVVDVACHNTRGQTVLAGESSAVDAAAERCEEAGGGVVPLTVSVPFHCRLLAPMLPAFGEALDATSFADPRLPVTDNVTARPLVDAAAVRRSLLEQVTRPVLFEESLGALLEGMPASGSVSTLGWLEDRAQRQRPSIEPIRHFIQCGPGDSLLGFVRRITREVTLETFEAAATRLGTGWSEPAGSA